MHKRDYKMDPMENIRTDIRTWWRTFPLIFRHKQPSRNQILKRKIGIRRRKVRGNEIAQHRIIRSFVKSLGT